MATSDTFQVYYEPPPPPSPLHLSGYVDSFSTKAWAGHYAHLSWIFNRPDSSHTETDSFVMFKDNNRVLSLPYTLNGWTDPVKYGYIGESHTYQLYAWYHWLPPYAHTDVFLLSNLLTLTAESSTPPGSGCPYFYIKENGAYIPQNTIMHYGYGNKRDEYLFNYSIGEKGALRKKKIIDDRGENQKRVMEAAISENEIERDYIDRFNLKAIKYDSSYNLALNGEGEYIFWKDVYRIDSCKNAVGEDILPLVSNSGDGYYVALPGDTIYIYADIRNGNKADIGEKRNKDSGILIGSGVKPKEKGRNVEPSIEIEYTGGKGWLSGGEIYPREYVYPIYNNMPLGSRIRLIIRNEVKIDYISFPRAEDVKYNEIELKPINPMLRGKNVIEEIIKEDSVYINLVKGDTLYFSFPRIPPANGENVSYILETDGYYNADNNGRYRGTGNVFKKKDIEIKNGIVHLHLRDRTFSHYEIYSISGRRIGEGAIEKCGIKIGGLCRGVYFIKLKGKEGIETDKFEVIR